MAEFKTVFLDEVIRGAEGIPTGTDIGPDEVAIYIIHEALQPHQRRRPAEGQKCGHGDCQDHGLHHGSQLVHLRRPLLFPGGGAQPPIHNSAREHSRGQWSPSMEGGEDPPHSGHQ